MCTSKLLTTDTGPVCPCRYWLMSDPWSMILPRHHLRPYSIGRMDVHVKLDPSEIWNIQIFFFLCIFFDVCECHVGGESRKQENLRSDSNQTISWNWLDCTLHLCDLFNIHFRSGSSVTTIPLSGCSKAEWFCVHQKAMVVELPAFWGQNNGDYPMVHNFHSINTNATHFQSAPLWK